MGLAERIDAHLAWPSKPKGLFAAFNNPDGPPWLKQMVENFSLEKDFTPEEARFVLKGRLHHIFSSLQFNISRSAILDSYMRHAGGSSTVWARHYGLVQTATNLANLLLAPVVGCLSDTIGRKPLMIFGRIGWSAWWLIVANVEAISARTGMTALNIRLIGEVLCWGVFSAGNWSAFTAAQADLFGTRPELMAKVGTTGGKHDPLASASF